MARPKGTGKAPEERFITRTIRFPPELWARIERAAPTRRRAEFIRGAIERELRTRSSWEPATSDVPIWERVDELLADLTPEELQALPVDGSEQHDHYIYGTPKRAR